MAALKVGVRYVGGVNLIYTAGNEGLAVKLLVVYLQITDKARRLHHPLPGQ